MTMNLIDATLGLATLAHIGYVAALTAGAWRMWRHPEPDHLP